MGLLSWILAKFQRQGAPPETASPGEPTDATNVLAPVPGSLEDDKWFYIPRSSAVSRIKFSPHGQRETKDSGVVSVVYKSGGKEYDSVMNVPREEFYALAFAESVGRYLELIFWPQFSQDPGKHRHGMPGGNTIKRGGRARWHKVPSNRANTRPNRRA